MLLVNETPFSELPKYKEVIKVPDIAHSTVEEHFGANV